MVTHTQIKRLIYPKEDPRIMGILHADLEWRGVKGLDKKEKLTKLTMLPKATF